MKLIISLKLMLSSFIIYYAGKVNFNIFPGLPLNFFFLTFKPIQVYPIKAYQKSHQNEWIVV